MLDKQKTFMYAALFVFSILIVFRMVPYILGTVIILFSNIILRHINKLINNLSDSETNILTDACKIFTLKDEDVYLVEGEVTNIKITYPYDLKLANTILEDSHD